MSRKSAPDDTGKNLNELITMSVSLPSGKWNLIDIPCGLARGEPSGRLAVDDAEVRFCTHLKGKASWFLPFNEGLSTAE